MFKGLGRTDLLTRAKISLRKNEKWGWQDEWQKEKWCKSWKILNMPLTAHKLGRILWKYCLRKEKVAIVLVISKEASLGLENQLAASGIRWAAAARSRGKKRRWEWKGGTASSHWRQIARAGVYLKQTWKLPLTSSFYHFKTWSFQESRHSDVEFFSLLARPFSTRQEKDLRRLVSDFNQSTFTLLEKFPFGVNLYKFLLEFW